MSNEKKAMSTLGALADEQAERNPRIGSARGRVAGGGKPTSRPLIASGRPLRRYELIEPDQASEEVKAEYELVPVITLGAIDFCTIDTREGQLDKRMLSRELDVECLTQLNDVVVALSAPFSCACIDENTQGLYIPNTCAVIRMDDKTKEVLDPWFLAGYLNLDLVKTRVFNAMATEGSWKTLRIEDLRSFEVPLPPIEIQCALGEALKADALTLQRERAARQHKDALVQKAYARVMAADRRV